MGDIAKSYFMKDRGHLSGTLSLSLVIFEKACDMLSLLLWCAFGLLLYPQKDELFWVMTIAIIAGIIIGLIDTGITAVRSVLFSPGYGDRALKNCAKS